ncbi:hypothetical protein [Hydrogenovibrio kuenenii]|uniref:hypothetical protein n=1 Tax=Hydrogenovibrio kuenenii TaxID=63658 RepID=UPI0004634828|nr:hypothetical protein [Hydrogenovibrio kuenenii]
MRETFLKLGLYKTIFFVALFLVRPPVYAAESLGKIFLSPQQRALIEQQRKAYLQKQQVKTQTETDKKPIAKKTKSARLAPDLSLSSIITTPEGQSFRLNGQYVKSSKAGYKVHQGQTNTSSTKVSLHGKVIRLKVGETYVPVKGKVEKTYVVTPIKQKEKLKLNTPSAVSALTEDEKRLDLSAELKTLQRLTQAAK